MIVELSKIGHLVYVHTDEQSKQTIDAAIYKALSYTDTSKKFLNKRWGRDIHVTDFSAYSMANSSFPFGLADRVIKCLLKLGANPSTDWTNDAIDVKRPHDDRFRLYQNQALEALLTHRSGHISIPTGGGKSFVIGGIIDAFQLEPKLVVVPSVEILDQLYDMLCNQYTSQVVSKIGGNNDVHAQQTHILVATFQTLCSRIKTNHLVPAEVTWVDHFLRTARVVVVDECHHCPCDSILMVLGAMPKIACSYGVSATPYRGDGLDMLMEGAVGPLRYEISAKTLKEQGYLVPGTVMMQTVEKKGRVPRPGKNYSTIYKHYLAEYKERNDLIIQQCISTLGMNLSTICFVKYVEHAQAIYDGVRADPSPFKRLGFAILTGAHKKDVRQRTLDWLRDGTIKLLISTIGKEGLDIPSLGGVILAGGGSDPSQEIGRALRPFIGKKDAYIFDTYDQQHFMLESQSKSRLKWYEEQEIFQVVRL